METDVQSTKSGVEGRPAPDDEKPASAGKIRISMDKRVDLAILVVIIAIGVFLLMTAHEIRIGKQPDPITSRGFPQIMGIYMIAGGLFLIALRLKNWFALPGHLVPSEGKDDDEESVPASAWRAFGIIFVSFLWVILLKPLGYLIVTWLHLGAFSLILGERSWLKITGLATVYTILTWYIFSQPLQIRLPLGPLYQTFRAWGLAI